MRRISKISELSIYFFKKFPKYMVSAVVFLLLSQLFIVTSLFLPIKVVVLLSQKEVPNFLGTVLGTLDRTEIIMLLTLLVFVVYGLSILFEKIAKLSERSIIKQLFKSEEELNYAKNKIVHKFVTSYIKYIATFFFLILLFLITLYFYPLIGFVIFIYLISILLIFLYNKIKEDNRSVFFKISFGIGFMLIFVLEVVDTLFFHSQETSLLIMLLTLVLSRYIFLRGAYMMNQLLFIYANIHSFYEKVGLVKK